VKIKLSLKQQEIVNHQDGALLVKAGPGSGKTRVLIERIKKLLLTKKRCKVLALTFSNLAAEEMKTRLEEDDDIEELINNVTIGTIHSFCLDVVQKRGNLIGLEPDLVLFEDTTDRQNVLREIFYRDLELKVLLHNMEKPDNYLLKCLNMISEQKKKFISPNMWEGDETFRTIYEGYNEYLIEQNAIDFDDILFYTYRILSENPSVVKLYTSVYRYICVDEAQDLNFAQYEVLKTLCGESFNNIMLVGDENQSIYGFNGSDSTLMTQSFVNDFSSVVYVLNENFRSAKAIVRYANTLENSSSVSNYYYEGELKAFSLYDEEHEARFVYKKINILIEEGHKDIEGDLGFNNFAVIARNRYVLNKIEQLFDLNKVPYYFKKTVSGIDSESDIMKIFELSMRILINPKDIIHLKKICNMLKVDIPQSDKSADGISILILILQGEKYNAIIEALKLLESDRFNFAKALKYLKENTTNNLDQNDEENYLIYRDIEMWEKHWNKYTRQVQSELRSLSSFRNYISLGKTQDSTSSNGVALLTVHMSKGLQYEVVFVIGLNDGTLPDYRAVNANGKEMEQEKNNMFVAATRAKRLCYLTFPKNKKMPWGDIKRQVKSRFLNSVEVEDIDTMLND